MSVTSVLFICHGNICRSTMAEFILKDMVKDLNEEFLIESAAISCEELGNDTDFRTKKILREKGIPFTKRRARLMTKKDYDRFDYILCMDEENMRGMLRICGSDPEGKMHYILDFAGEKREVSDPWYTGDFEATYRDLCKGCKGFLQSL